MRTPLRRHPALQVHFATAMAVVAASSGVGCDSLLGEAGLGATFGDGVEWPEEVAWELRWFLGDGVESSCDLLEPADGEVVLDADFGSLELPPPAPEAASAVIDGGSFSWGLALLLVVDADASEDRPASAEAPRQSVWGVAPLHALLHVSGDLDAFSEALEVSSTDGDTGLVPGFQTVEVFPEQTDAGSFVGAIATADPTIVFTEADGAIVADPLELVDPAALRMVEGENLGGLRFEACP